MVSSIEEDLTLEVERTEGTGKRVNSYEFVRGREQLYSFFFFDKLKILELYVLCCSYHLETCSLVSHRGLFGSH